MKKVLCLLLLCSGLAKAQTEDLNADYLFSVDLTRVIDDKLQVELRTPAVTQEEIIYRMPAIVPGTYEVYDFGRFVSDFKAYDRSGKQLSAMPLDANSWKIFGANRMERITYTVEDTWDAKMEGDRVFEPGGTNIQKDTNFVINTHGFFGYFDGLKRRNYQLTFRRPADFFGATSLRHVSTNDNKDVFASPSYMELVDAPIMYCKPDTAHLAVGGCDVLIAVYSPHQLVSSKFIADNIRDILMQQKEYLGGTLPVKKYAFLIYLSPNGYASGSMGALEHSYSSLYCMPEMMPTYIGPRIRDFAAHEFFHIVTPLNIHSEEIGDFDYNNPKMSQHLWLYEGLTEYAAGLVQAKYGTMTLEQYVDLVTGKMYGAMRYKDDLPFTEMSKGVLDRYKDQYGNVYEKGALIGLCLDIKLRKLSNGKYGVQELMQDLSKKYGKDRSFKDEELIPHITQITYHEIGEFFRRHVQGAEPLPYGEVLNEVGIVYKAKQQEKKLTPFGGLALAKAEGVTGLVMIDLGGANSFGRQMGYMDNDVIKEINGQTITAANGLEIVKKLNAEAREGDKLKVVVERENEEGKKSRKTLKGKLVYVETVREHVLSLAENPGERQLEIRKAWINK